MRNALPRYTLLPVTILYNVMLGIGVLVSILFAALVFLTGKGDAMSGSGGVRTSFKGKATLEDTMSRLTFFLGVAFMASMLLVDALGNRIERTGGTAPAASTPASSTPAPTTPAPGPTTPAPINPAAPGAPR